MESVLNISINVDAPINKKSIDNAVKDRWKKALVRAAPNIQKDFRNGLISNGKYLVPFINTDLWKYLLMPSTIAELGFTSTKPLYDDLLQSISESTFVYARGSKLYIGVMDMTFVAQSTIHRSAGTGQLGDISWFVDWIIEGVPVQDYGFVQTGPPIPRSSRVAGTEAGLMIEGANGGFWRFPPTYKDSVGKWLKNNTGAMRTIIDLRMSEAIKKRL